MKLAKQGTNPANVIKFGLQKAIHTIPKTHGYRLALNQLVNRHSKREIREIHFATVEFPKICSSRAYNALLTLLTGLGIQTSATP